MTLDSDTSNIILIVKRHNRCYFIKIEKFERHILTSGML